VILNTTQARELGEALLDAVDAASKTQLDQAVVLLDSLAVAVPISQDDHNTYEYAAIVRS
tara:strand:+ start:281 stop:460 length:180 start_codon:yes stop_codon:yes gene_type:complete